MATDEYPDPEPLDAHDVALDLALILDRHDAIRSAEVTSYDEQDHRCRGCGGVVMWWWFWCASCHA